MDITKKPKIEPNESIEKTIRFRAVNESSCSLTTRARLDKKVVHVHLFINMSSLSLSFRLV